MSEIDNRGERTTSRSTLSFWVMVMIALPVLYVLSIGPAAALHIRFEFLQEPLEVIYYPLSLLFESEWGAPLQPFAIKYIKWWM